jgi:CBS domain-containing protein
MREHHVGDVVIVRQKKGRRIPVGILTDRDIVISVLGTNLDPNVFTAGDIMVLRLTTLAGPQFVLLIVIEQASRRATNSGENDARERVRSIVILLSAEFYPHVTLLPKPLRSRAGSGS